MAALRTICAHHIFALCPVVSSSIFFLAYSQPSQIACLPYFHTLCGLSANLGCRSETCCMRLAEIQDAKIAKKICHLRTIAQLGRTISSQLRHVSTIGKKLVKQQYLPHMFLQYGELDPLVAESGSLVWSIQLILTGFGSWHASPHGTLVMGVSETLRRWTEGATYIRQGGHHVGHLVHILVCFAAVLFIFSCLYCVAPLFYACETFCGCETWTVTR